MSFAFWHKIISMLTCSLVKLTGVSLQVPLPVLNALSLYAAACWPLYHSVRTLLTAGRIFAKREIFATVFGVPRSLKREAGLPRTANGGANRGWSENIGNRGKCQADIEKIRRATS